MVWIFFLATILSLQNEKRSFTIYLIRHIHKDNQVKGIRWEERETRMGVKANLYSILDEKLEG